MHLMLRCSILYFVFFPLTLINITILHTARYCEGITEVAFALEVLNTQIGRAHV